MALSAVLKQSVVAPVVALFAMGSLHAQGPMRQSLDIMVPNAPVHVEVAGVAQITYELHLTNFARDSLRLTRVQLLAGRGGDAVAALEDRSLDSVIGHTAARAAPASPLVIGPGARAVLYLDLPLQRPRLAGELSHRIDFEVASGGDRERYTVEGGTTTVHTAPLPELGPPLRGRFWAAVYDPAMERGHRRVFYAVGGRARIPGRFAIDWFGVDARGKVKKREGDRLTDYIGYGAEVLAVADAVVAAARDDVAEPETTIDLPRVSMADATGNYIALDLGGGRFAFYEHLRPGLRVRVGDRVRKGQVIAELGLTGSGSMPHLHFHVSDANSPLAAEGQPYRLSGFTTLGGFSSIEAFGRGEAWHRLPAARRNDSGLPAPNTVVELTP